MIHIIKDFLVQEMHIHKNEEGQSAIEFVLTFAFALGITLLFVNQALNLTSGYLNHYVNFMSSRAYLVHETGIDNVTTNMNASVDQARDVFNGYPIQNFGIKAAFEVITLDKGSPLFSGTVSQFEKSLSSLPVVGGGEKALFYSESFLGKEPLRITCSQMVCAAITGNPGECAQNAENIDIVLYDNGC